MTLKKHHRERLIRLADKLEGKGPYEDIGPVPAKRFDINLFWDEAFAPTECGTVACACGWAATDPWFKRKGFPQYYYADEIAEFFGMDVNDTDFLFMPVSYRALYPRPATVAKRIRTFVETQ